MVVMERAVVVSSLWKWFRAHGRHDLPWRKTRDPYKILVSEMMLQQTQVGRALIKYDEFLNKFPDVATLAAAPLGDALRAWSGLGYNRRAKYLWECARTVQEKHRGQFPKDFHALQEFPGIGRSTAAALCAFAFGADEPMIDTNIRRILMRIFFRKTIQNTIHDKALYDLAKTLIPKGRGREWNWAMMDVGALACKAKNHDDARCPFQKLHGKVGDFQYKKPAKKFQNSDRYYRGQIMQKLVKKKEGFRKQELMRALGIREERCEKILEALREERLILIKSQQISLP